MEYKPRHETVSRLSRTPIISGQIIAPLFVVQKRVERIDIHVITAGYYICISRRKISDTTITLRVESRGRAHHKYTDAVLRRHVYHIGKIQT